MVKLSQQRIAMQSRLDICAVRYLHIRKHFAENLITSNRMIRLTALALYMAKGLSALGGVAGKLLGSLGEAGLKKINHGSAHWQNTQLALYQTKELVAARCAPTPFSKDPAFCQPNSFLKQALQREKALLPDVYGPLVFRTSPLLRVTCTGKKQQTRLSLDGDTQLFKNSFSDFYEQ